MKKISAFTIIILSFIGVLANKRKQIEMDTTINEAVYKVSKLHGTMNIDGNWNKDQWKNIETIKVQRHMGEKSPFIPVVETKMMYDNQNVYVIFRVQDQFVLSTVTKYNGPVSKNSCVEFFFSPDSLKPLNYFNLEINAGGTPLMYFITKPKSEFKPLEEEDIKTIEISHSLPRVVYPEMKDPVTWTIEYKIPLSTIQKYSPVTHPGKGVRWKGNFYKTGSETSNPNYMTWSFVDNAKPNFHLPQFFGTLVFQ